MVPEAHVAIVRRRSRGFTLLEIMIALAVFSVVAAALIRSAAMAVSQTRLVEEQTLGLWVAENQLNQLRLLPRDAESYPRPGTERFAVTLADRQWEVRVVTEATENADIRRVTVDAALADRADVAVASLTGFVGRH